MSLRSVPSLKPSPRPRIVGFEGCRDQSSPVNWGIAAIAHEASVINAATSHELSLAEWQALVDVHTSHTPNINIEERFLRSPLVVVELTRADAIFPFLSVDTGKIGGLVAHRAGHTQYHYVFEDIAAFNAYAKTVVVKIAHALLYQPWQQEASSRLVRAGLVIAPTDPALNALRVSSITPARRQQARLVAIAMLRTEASREEFDALFDALTTDDDQDYVIKYKDGIAEGGGLDVDRGARILQSALAAHVPFAKELHRRYPYLAAPPPPRFHYMKAASASLHFTAQIKGRPLGERIARQLELRMLEQSLRGDELPSKIDDREKLERALSQLRSPDSKTTVSHVPIGGKEERLSGSTKVAGRATTSEPFVLLGYQSGLINLADQVEIVLFPEVGGRHRARLRLSTQDDGDKNEPHGVEPLRQGLLYRPLLVTIVRRVDSEGRETTHLRRVKPLQPKESGVVTAIPSSVVDGALLYGFSFELRRPTADRLVWDLGPITGVSTQSLDGAKKWTAHYAARCAHFELQPDLTFRYWRPAKPPAPSALQRILVVLKAEGGRVHQARLTAQINERYGSTVRLNNTRREVINNPNYLAFQGEDRRIISWTPQGELLAAAFERAGGRTQQKRKRRTAST